MQSSILTQYLLPLSLFIIMMGMGMSLVIEDFKRVMVNPKAIIIGLLGQILALPVLAFILVITFKPDPLIAVGVMLIAACPGGTSSNLISHLAKGDTALSICLTALSSLITIISIPLIVGYSINYFLAADQAIKLPIIKTLITLIVITLVPVSLGMWIRQRHATFAIKQESRINIFSGLFLAFLVLMILWQQLQVVKGGIATAGWLVASLNASSLVLGLLLGLAFKLNKSQTTTLSVEIGVQNGTLAILVATTILNQPVLAVPAAIYSLAMFASGFMIIFWRRFIGNN